MKLQVKKLTSGARIPTRGTEESIGYDLYAGEKEICDVVFGDVTKVHTGISVNIPRGYYGRIAPRSGLAAKHGIQVLAGVIDADYRGELIVILTSSIKGTYLRIKPGDRIAQLILEREDALPIQEVDEFDGGETERGASGFGSTGV